MWLLYAPPVPIVHCHSVLDLPSGANGVLGIWLSGEPDIVIDELRDLRRQCSHAYLPIFIDGELPVDVRHLSDGSAGSVDEALRLAMEWRPSPTRLQGVSSGPALALARYLYLRPLAALTPIRDCKAHQAYRYPLLEAFTDGEAPHALLGTLLNRGWLEQTHLVDRLRRCENCRSAHLNYVDVCPSCQSLNIEEAAYVHCFTCSHMAPQEKFIQNMALVCPNCQARLRHIGADYNRPLEQMHCRDCTMAFSEAEVLARCLACGHSHEPAKLPVLTVVSYSLSDSGRQAARQGLDSGWPAPAPMRTQGMQPEAFIDMTDWMMSLARRHGQAGFALLGLYLDVTPSLADSLGETGLHTLVDAFASRLRELMRDTDILTRVSDHLFWIALPQTTRAGAHTLLEKIQAFAEKTVQDDGSRLEIRGVIHAADEIAGEVSAEHLLNTLGSRLQRGLPC